MRRFFLNTAYRALSRSNEGLSASARPVSSFRREELPSDHQKAIAAVSDSVSKGDQVGAIQAVVEARKEFPENWRLYLWEAKLRTTNSVLNRFGADPGMIDLVNDWYDRFLPEGSVPTTAEAQMASYKTFLGSSWDSDEVLDKKLREEESTYDADMLEQPMA